MRTVRLLSTGALLVVSFLNSFGQTSSTTPEERAQYWDDWMKTEVLITPDQEAEVHAINLKYAQLNEQLKNVENSKRSKLQEMRLNEDRKEKEFKVLLTKEQFKRYREKKKVMQQQLLRNRK